MATLPGEGTLLQMGDGAGTEVFTTIGQRVSIEGPETTVEAVEKTNLDSTMKEYRPSKVPDPGTLSMTIQYDPANVGHTSLKTRSRTPTVNNYRLVFNNETTTRPHMQFAAFVTSFNPTGMEVEENLQAEVEFQVTGAFTDGNTTI
jgi:hypothetical protein